MGNIRNRKDIRMKTESKRKTEIHRIKLCLNTMLSTMKILSPLCVMVSISNLEGDEAQLQTGGSFYHMLLCIRFHVPSFDCMSLSIANDFICNLEIHSERTKTTWLRRHSRMSCYHLTDIVENGASI